jgi:3-oxoacyl-[acyl-carrier protein] reductase
MLAEDRMTTRHGRTAIVTGASRGIGAAVAQRLAGDGFNIVVNYAGRGEEAETQVELIRQAGGTAITVRADVSDPAATRALFGAAGESFGVLVNNAGIMQLATLAEADDAFFDRHVAINLSKLAPLERLGEPADIAAVVAFLAGPDGAWINGQVLRANGGII